MGSRGENFAVANFSGVSRFTDDIDRLFQLVSRRCTCLTFGREIHAVLRAAVQFRRVLSDGQTLSR